MGSSPIIRDEPVADDDIQQVCLLRGTKRGEDTAACPPRKIGRLPMCAPLALGGALAGGAHRSRLGRGLRLRRLRGLLGGFGGGSGLRCGGGRVGLGRRGLLGCGARRLRGRPWPRALRWRWSSWRSSSCAQSSSPARAFAAGALSAALAFRGSGLSCRGLRSRGLGCGHLGGGSLGRRALRRGLLGSGGCLGCGGLRRGGRGRALRRSRLLGGGLLLGLLSPWLPRSPPSWRSSCASCGRRASSGRAPPPVPRARARRPRRVRSWAPRQASRQASRQGRPVTAGAGSAFASATGAGSAGAFSAGRRRWARAR